MAKKMVRNRAALIDKKSATLARAQSEVEKLADRLSKMRGDVSKLDVDDSDKAIEKLSKLTGEIASTETVLKALEARRDRAQAELDAILATVDQDEVDRLKKKEIDALRLAVHQTQELYGTQEALYETQRELRAAGGRPEDVPLSNARGTMEHLRIYFPEMIGLPPRRSSKEMTLLAGRRRLDALKKLLADVQKQEGDTGGLINDYKQAIKRQSERLQRQGVEVKTEDEGVQLPSLGEFTDRLLAGKEHGPTVMETHAPNAGKPADAQRRAGKRS